jgi:hypothetical protein
MQQSLQLPRQQHQWQQQEAVRGTAHHPPGAKVARPSLQQLAATQHLLVLLLLLLLLGLMDWERGMTVAVSLTALVTQQHLLRCPGAAGRGVMQAQAKAGARAAAAA